MVLVKLCGFHHIDQSEQYDHVHLECNFCNTNILRQFARNLVASDIYVIR